MNELCATTSLRPAYTCCKRRFVRIVRKENEKVRHNVTIRPAARTDAEFMAPLINQAGQGLPHATWASLAQEGEIMLDVGLARIRSTESWISWQKSWIAEVEGARAGVLVTYLHGAEMPAPDPETPAPFVPLLELEALASNSRYILIVSTTAEYQGRGVGSALLAHSEMLDGPGRMSLIVSDSNPLARKLYERIGYRAIGCRPIVSVQGWDNAGTEWVLMIKDVA